MGNPLVESGRCDPLLCNTQVGETSYNFIVPGDSTSAIGSSCCNMNIPNSVPIKQLLKGTLLSPWVRIRFEGAGDPSSWDNTEITTGNISQPYTQNLCYASIKSFQYAWGTVQQGNKCKVKIVDQEGSSFSAWWKRIYKNPIGGTTDRSSLGVYKMKITFGWLITGGDGTCGTDDDSSSVVSSPAMWFVPQGITASLENGVYVYEVEGCGPPDLAMDQSCSLSFGDEPGVEWPNRGGVHFSEAVQLLGLRSLPPFNVEFRQLPLDGSESLEGENLQFFVDEGVASLNYPHRHYDNVGNPSILVNSLTPPDLRANGPLGVWKCQGVNPLSSIQEWMTRVAGQGISNTRLGLTMNYDPTWENNVPSLINLGMPAKGRLLIWSESLPAGCRNSNRNYDPLLKATYVVNGGRCSPVISFNYNVNWNFQKMMNAGGTAGGNYGQMISAMTNRACSTPGIGLTTTITPPTSGLNSSPRNGGNIAIENAAAHHRANMIYDAIEAELKVQGDPSSWLCTPLYGNGKTIALVVINPFFLDANSVNENTDCPNWVTLTDSVCNDVMTNKGWIIQSVEHQISEGTYVTTYKLKLLAPRAEVGSENSTTPLMLGLDVSRQGACNNSDKLLCNQGTFNCESDILVADYSAIKAGPGTFCQLPGTCNEVPA